MEDNLMGYQESMLVCNTKENFERLKQIVYEEIPERIY